MSISELCSRVLYYMEQGCHLDDQGDSGLTRVPMENYERQCRPAGIVCYWSFNSCFLSCYVTCLCSPGALGSLGCALHSQQEMEKPYGYLISSSIWERLCHSQGRNPWFRLSSVGAHSANCRTFSSLEHVCALLCSGKFHDWAIE